MLKIKLTTDVLTFWVSVTYAVAWGSLLDGKFLSLFSCFLFLKFLYAFSLCTSCSFHRWPDSLPQLLLKEELFKIFSGRCIEVKFEGFNFYIYISERKGLSDVNLALIGCWWRIRDSAVTNTNSPRWQQSESEVSRQNQTSLILSWFQTRELQSAALVVAGDTMCVPYVICMTVQGSLRVLFSQQHCLGKYSYE